VVPPSLRSSFSCKLLAAFDKFHSVVTFLVAVFCDYLLRHTRQVTLGTRCSRVNSIYSVSSVHSTLQWNCNKSFIRSALASHRSLGI